MVINDRRSCGPTKEANYEGTDGQKKKDKGKIKDKTKLIGPQLLHH